MLSQRVNDGKARGRQAEPEIIIPAIRPIEPVALPEQSSPPLRVAVQGFLIMAAIVVVTFALLVLLDYAGIHLTPTAEMLTAD